MNFKGLGTPILDLDPYLDIQSLKSHKKDLDLAIAKSINSLYFSFHPYEELYIDQHAQYLDWMRIYLDNKHQFEELEHLSHNQKALFLLLNQDCVSLGNFIVVLRESEKNENFSFLLDWISNQDLYSELKSCFIYLSTEGKEVLKHFDRDAGSTQRQLVWITLDNRKKLYVEDGEVRRISNSNSVTFLPNLPHGTEFSRYMSYSIRLEGTFSESFKKKTGLDQHFN